MLRRNDTHIGKRVAKPLYEFEKLLIHVQGVHAKLGRCESFETCDKSFESHTIIPGAPGGEGLVCEREIEY